MPLASVYPLVSTRSLARPFTYEVPEGVGKGAVVAVRLGRSSTRGVVADVGVEAPEGIEPALVGRVLDEIPPPLVDLALWVADYYGSTPARALELVAPVRRAPRGERPSPALRESLAGEPEPQSLTADQQVAIERIVSALDQGVGDHLLLEGPTGSGKTEVYLQACACCPRAWARHDRARAGDRAGPADRRTIPAALRRPGRDPPLVARRRRATRRARPGRARRGEDRGRRPLGDLRADARGRPDRRRRGARHRLQAGVRPALRRAHRRRQARGARGRRRRLRLRDAAARELGASRAARRSARGSERRFRP